MNYSVCKNCGIPKIRHTAVERGRCSKSMQATPSPKEPSAPKVLIPDYNLHNNRKGF